MALVEVVLDHAAIGEMLKSAPFASLVHVTAEGVANHARRDTGADVVVDDYMTDRAASSVTIRHPRAKAWQATRGVLTRAAASQGLEVRGR